MARRATVINQERESHTPLLILDAGDSLTGDRDPARSTQGESSIAAMNLMGYDAMVLGPKDIDLGLTALSERSAEAEFDLLSANAVVSDTGELVTDAYALRYLSGHTIAIAGLSGGDGNGEIAILDPLEAARAVTAEVTHQADIIILLSHAGSLTDQQIANTVPSIDLIISGGAPEIPSPWRSAEMDTLVLHADAASPGHAGRRLGIARLVFNDAGQLADFRWQRLNLGPQIASDPVMTGWIQQQLSQ
jgi:2',3'-cyclic-nucleotide 2'-phosphodiesterase (5'-nucleotidase family)